MGASGANSLSAASLPIVVAVIVTFNPDVRTLDAQLAALRSQVPHVVIVDNGSDDAAAKVVRDLAEMYCCDANFLGRNEGIAAAQNRGIETALSKHADYVLLLDHDSIPSAGMVGALVASDHSLRARNVRVAAVGPVTIDKRNGVAGQFVKLDGLRVKRNGCAAPNGVIEADFLIASGTLLHVSAIAEFGLMNEGLFIDHVDTDWCFRARHQGGRIFGVCAAHLHHALGDSAQRVWLGRWRHVFVHSPTRDYYIFRNTVLLVRHTPMPLWWKLHFLFRLCQFLVYFSVGVAPRLRRLKCMAVGVVHGLSGKTGRMPAGV
jgi:rhamnosyltransferase